MNARWLLLLLVAACSSHDENDADTEHDAAMTLDGALAPDGATLQDAASGDAAGSLTSNAFGDSFIWQWTDNFTEDASVNPQLWEAADGIGPSFGPNGVDFSLLDSGMRKGYIGTAPTLFGRYETRMYNAPIVTDQAGYLVRLNATQLKWNGNTVQENPPFEDWNEIDLEIYEGNYVTAGSLMPTYNLHFGDWTAATLYNDVPAAMANIVPAGWHDWVIEWTPNYVAWYVDGAVRHVMHNRSWKPGWTPLSGASDDGRTGDGSGMESLLYPMSWVFGSNAGANTPTSADKMYVASATYSSLAMQSFAGIDFAAHGGGTTGIDSKGSEYIGGLGPGDYLQYEGVDPRWKNISMKVDASASGRQILVRTQNPLGPIIATIDVPVTHGPEWLYDDLVIQPTTTQVASAARPFSQQGTDVGKTFTITGGTGFTAGTYTITAVSATHIATLSASAGTAGATAGKATLAWTDPTHYTLVSANLSASSNGFFTTQPDAPRSVFLTFAGPAGNVNIHEIYFFGTEPSSDE